jgi:hypothetical protein
MATARVTRGAAAQQARDDGRDSDDDDDEGERDHGDDKART